MCVCAHVCMCVCVCVYVQTFAESTMNELLGWYGYDKVELRDSEASEIRNYRERRQHVSVLKGKGSPCTTATGTGAGKAQVTTR